MNDASFVRLLQQMLNLCAPPHAPALPVSGTFNEETLEAVIRFQQEAGLPVNGIVDADVWSALLTRSNAGRGGDFFPVPPEIFPIPAGARRPQVYLAQTMLDCLGRTLHGLPPTGHDGILHGPTSHGLRTIQRGSGLPETGILDRKTWATLTRLFRMFTLPRSATVFSVPLLP